MRGSARLLAADVGSLKFDVVVVGGGAAGCLIAGRLGMENIKTLVLEQGVDVRQKPSWHYTLPSGLLAHRVAQRGYETRHIVPSPAGLAGDQTNVVLPAPRVLGGRGVMGSRTWNLGDCRDWANAPWSFRDDLIPRIRKLENMENFVPHRGKRGRFLIGPARNFSPYYKPFCEAISAEVPLISEFTRSNFRLDAGCGRADTFVNQDAGRAHSTMEHYLMETVRLQRPLRVECGATVVGIRGGAGGREATGVAFQRPNGEMVEVEASLVIVCAGTIGSAKVLAASRGSIAAGAEVGQGLWDVPQMVLQYRTKDRLSHNSYLDPLSRQVLRLGLGRGVPPLSLCSTWDDLITYWSDRPERKEDPEVEILFQPFTLNNTGDQVLPGEHGCQFIIRPVRPMSRGVVSADGTVDPKYWSAAADEVAMKKGVEMVKELVKKASGLQRVVGPLVSERLESSGNNGGSCFAAIDPSTFLLRGTSNVYVGGDAILPSPLTGSSMPYTMVLAEMLSDKVLGKQNIREQVEREADTSTRIVY